MPDELAVLPPIPQLNSIKNKMALAFVHALNATVNYSLQENSREFDNAGADLTIASFLVGQNRSVASGANQINVQLKGVAASSVTMFSEDETSIVYTLSDDLHQFGVSMYLFVIVLPEDDKLESWREINDSDVLLRARGYYVKVEDKIDRGKVKIPKTQRLIPETYKDLFIKAAEEVQT